MLVTPGSERVKGPRKRSQHCCQQHPIMLRAFEHTISLMLLGVVGYCCARFEMFQSFEPTSPNNNLFCMEITEAYRNDVAGV